MVLIQKLITVKT
ncbi:hypothetical protein FWK35_00036664 [Aphis craccivora]|uniref:Uncharacterized protein n=1 Tax=Aphis craccivora TaxID=307492 RepID=A0A6G0Y1D8_APHCR|nr:hypothetical protein FWK35_00036664 [Aphis craccivora]